MIVRLFFILVLFSFISYADSCYSVALWSVTKDSNKIKNSIKNDKNCKIFEISSQITQRCGCYDDISDAKKLLKKYVSKFHTAYVTLTLKSRFKQTPKALPKSVELSNISTVKQDIKINNYTKVDKSSDMTFSILATVILILIMLIMLIWRFKAKKKHKQSKALKSILID
jgi:ATP-dependent Zn protease